MHETTSPPTASRPEAQSFALSVTRRAMRLLSRTAPAVASRVAADLFMTPRRHRTPERERQLIASATPFSIPLGGGSLAAWKWGSGPAVILVHGWEGRGSQMGAFAQPLVDAGFSVIAFDAPGHGASPGSRSSLPHFTWALRAAADAAGSPHAVIAHSLGCAATALALREGLQVQRLVFVAPPLEPAEYTNQFGEILGLDDSVIEGLRDRIEQRFVRRWSDYSLANAASRMTTPLLVVHDRDDVETRYSGGARIAETWPGARLVTTEGLGHRKVLRDRMVIDAATGFIAG